MESVTPEARTQYDKGLKTGALGMTSSVVIGVASTAPRTASRRRSGLVAAAVGLQSPAIMIVAFIPMLLIARAYYYMNKADPDCGTSFSWVTRAFGLIPGSSPAGSSWPPTPSSWPTSPKSRASTCSCCSAGTRRPPPRSR